ncbi:MAG: electron transfer flavoprotein subunit alpha/FixB family protein [Candidatus Bipolaricaulia bacterium]
MLLVCPERKELMAELLAGGRWLKDKLGMGLFGALIGEDVKDGASECFSHGAERVYLAEGPELKDFYVEPYAEALYRIAGQSGAKLLLLSSTKRGKELAARVAQKLGAGCVTDVIGLRVEDGRLLAARYSLGGNTVSTRLIKTDVKVIAVMPGTFEVGQREPKDGELIRVDPVVEEHQVKLVERKRKGEEEARIEEAETLICVGRGLEKEEDLGMIRELAAVLGGEIGCTRSLASDYHWLEESRNVGISGKRCKPRLCISIGISGQIQHTVGIMGSKTIVAINKDPEAPIFRVADYGIVGDLYQVVPKLIERLKA